MIRLSKAAHRRAVAELVPELLKLVLVGRGRVNTEVMENGRRQVGGGHRAVLDESAVGRCLPVDLSPADAAAGKERGLGIGPMVTAGLPRVVALCELPQLRSAAKL